MTPGPQREVAGTDLGGTILRGRQAVTTLVRPRPQDVTRRSRLNGEGRCLTRAAALVAVLTLAWMFLEWGGPSPTIAKPERSDQTQELEADRLRLVAQAQTTPPADAVPPADLERQRAEAARKAEQDAAARLAEQQIRRLQDGIFRQADEEAAARRAQRRGGEATGQPEAARSRPQEVESAKRPAEAERGGARTPPPSPITPAPIARPADPAAAVPRLPAISAQEVSRIQNQAEQRLRSRGLFRESSADRWGVTVEVGPAGTITLSGLLRDTRLHDEAVRLVREIPGVRGVMGDVRVPERSAPGASVQIREQIQQKLRSRGLLRESRADRWGVSVLVSPEGDVTLVGALRDAGLQKEAIRLAQEVAGARSVTDEISVMEQADRP